MRNSELLQQLKEKGLETWMLENFVCFKFTVPHGRFKGKEIVIGLDAPQFPLIPPAGPYIKPHLLPISGGGGAHPFGGIHAMNLPTPEFQYWSRPYNGWRSSMNIEDYLGFIRTLFDIEI